MNIACVQMDVIPGGVEENLSLMAELATTAAENEADLVVFPELATSDYYVKDFASLAARIPGEQSAALAEMAAKRGLFLAAGLIERAAEGIYNTAILVAPSGSIVGKARKTHLSVDARGGTIRKETEVFLPGEELSVLDAPFGKVGIMICKDGEYPEVPRVLALRGAEIILWMNNRSRANVHASVHYAVANKCLMVVCNRAQGHVAGGQSVVLDWDGNTLAEAGSEPQILYAKADMEALRLARRTHWTESRVRRPSLYKDIGEILSPIQAD